MTDKLITWHFEISPYLIYKHNYPYRPNSTLIFLTTPNSHTTYKKIHTHTHVTQRSSN
jgi:hypothetical protein